MNGPRLRQESAAPGRSFRASVSRGARAVTALLAASLLLTLASGPGAGRSSGPADPLATLKVGAWVRLEGPLQADSTGLCQELRILTGDFLDDDWSVRGFVTAVDAARQEIVIGGVRIQVTEDTGFDGPKKTFSRFSDLHTGDLLEVEGAYLKNRRILAREMDDESDDVSHTPRNQIRVVAKVERVDARKRLVTAMGFAFQLTDRTRIRSAIE